MDRGTRNLFAFALVIVIAITGGAALILGGGGAAPTGGDAPPGTNAAEGVIVAIDAAGLDDIRGFTLRQDGGATLVFSLALENPTEFPPGHLAEHQATADPVVVRYREQEGDLVAVRIDDAP